MPPLAALPQGFFDAIVERRMTVFQWIDHAGSLELDGAELYPKFLDSFDSAYLKKVRSAAASRGLELPMFCNSPNFTQPDPADRKKEIERTREMFRVTAELGGKYCRVLSGLRSPQMTKALVMSIPVIGTFVADALLFTVWLLLDTCLMTAASRPAGASRQAASAPRTRPSRALRTVSKPMSDRGLRQGVCHAGGGLAGPWWT